MLCYIKKKKFKKIYFNIFLNNNNFEINYYYNPKHAINCLRLLSLAVFLGKVSTNKNDRRTCHIKGKKKKEKKRKGYALN